MWQREGLMKRQGVLLSVLHGKKGGGGIGEKEEVTSCREGNDRLPFTDVVKY